MKKGITLIVLALYIIISSILLGIIVFNSMNSVVQAEKTSLKSDIAQLEVLMSTYKMRKDGVIGFETTNIDVSALSSDELKQFDGENIINNTITLYIIDLDEIDAEDVTYGKLVQGEKDRYLYSITTGKVYYEQGLLLADGTYYYIEDGEW